MRFLPKRSSSLWCAGASLFWAAVLPPADAQGQSAGSLYYPTTDREWQRRRPAEVGLDSARLWEAIRWVGSEITKDPPLPTTVEETKAIQEKMLRAEMREPQPFVIGDMLVPAGQGGLVLRHGYIVAEFGKSRAVNTNASLTKSILSIVAGVASTGS